jgi:hypothetical protein
VRLRIRGRGSEFSEVELIPGDAEVLDDVGDDTARDITRMPREGDQAIGPKWIRVMPMAARGAKEFTADFTEAPLQLPAVPSGVLAHGSGGEHEFVAEGWRDGPSGFEQCFQMGLGGLLETERGFAPVAPVRVTAGEQVGLGDPHAVLIPTQLHFREWNDHIAATLTRPAAAVKRAFNG